MTARNEAEAIQRRLDNLIRVVAEMRHAQREYLRTRSRPALTTARQAAERVDKMLADLQTPKLF